MNYDSAIRKPVSLATLLSLLCFLNLTVGTAGTAKAVAPLFGTDFDSSGVVDEQDLLLWSGSFGFDGGADANGDGYSDVDDLYLWKADEEASVVPVVAPFVSPGPEVLYNRFDGSLSLAPKGLDIYAFFLTIDSTVSSLSNAELPSSSNGSWELQNILNSIQGYDTSMLAYLSPVQSDNSLDQVADVATIATLQTGLSGGDFGSLTYGLHGDDSVGNFSLVIVPEPAALILIATGLIGLGCGRRR